MPSLVTLNSLKEDWKTSLNAVGNESSTLLHFVMSHILIFNLYQNLLIGFYNLSFIFENTEAKKY